MTSFPTHFVLADSYIPQIRREKAIYSSSKRLRSDRQSFYIAEVVKKIKQNCEIYATRKFKDIPAYIREGQFGRRDSTSIHPRCDLGDIKGSTMPADKAGRVIFVGNIPYGELRAPASVAHINGAATGLSEEQVVHLFRNCGQVLNFRLVYDKDTGRPKGFGFAEFSDADSAATAVRNLNGHEIMGRTLRVDYSNEAGGGGDSSSQNTQQQSISQQQHFQQFQQMHQQSPQSQTQANGQAPSLNIPPGVTLPDNVNAPDAISRTLSAMDPQQLLNVISQLKEMVNSEPQRAHLLLTRSPQLSYAIFQALLLMGLVDTSVLSQVVEASSQQQSQQQPQQQPQHQQAPLPFHQSYQAPSQAPQFLPTYQQQVAMGTPPVHGQLYAPPPPVPQKPPNMTDQQWDSIRKLCSIPQQQIDAMQNETERQSIINIRNQYMPFLGSQFMGVQSY